MRVTEEVRGREEPLEGKTPRVLQVPGPMPRAKKGGGGTDGGYGINRNVVQDSRGREGPG